MQPIFFADNYFLLFQILNREISLSDIEYGDKLVNKNCP